MEAQAPDGVGADYIIPNFLCHDELLKPCFRPTDNEIEIRSFRPLAIAGQAAGRREHDPSQIIGWH
jgi:hypothetical protein